MGIVRKNITLCEFRDAFRESNYSEVFSYTGLKLLYNYLKDLSEELGEDIDLDITSLCVEYEEVDTTDGYEEIVGQDTEKGVYIAWCV